MSPSTTTTISHLFTDLDSTFFHWGYDDDVEDKEVTIKGRIQVPKKGMIKSKTFQAVEVLQQQGVKVIPCTGRSLSESIKCMKELKLEFDSELKGDVPNAPVDQQCPMERRFGLNPLPGIYSDGLVIFDEHGKIVYQSSLSGDLLLAALIMTDRFIEGMGPTYESAPVVSICHPNAKTVLNHPECPFTQESVHEKKRGCKLTMRLITDYSEGMVLDSGDSLGKVLSSSEIAATPSSSPLIQAAAPSSSVEGSVDHESPLTDLHFVDLFEFINRLDDPVLAIMIVVPHWIEPEQLAFFRSLIPTEYSEILDVRLMFDTGFAITMKNADKGGAVRKYMELFSAEGIRTVSVIGDGVNDLPMLQLVRDLQRGYAFVMGQARDDVKAIGTHIVKSSKEDGWHEAAEMILNHNSICRAGSVTKEKRSCSTTVTNND